MTLERLWTERLARRRIEALDLQHALRSRRPFGHPQLLCSTLPPIRANPRMGKGPSIDETFHEKLSLSPVPPHLRVGVLHAARLHQRTCNACRTRISGPGKADRAGLPGNSRHLPVQLDRTERTCRPPSSGKRASHHPLTIHGRDGCAPLWDAAGDPGEHPCTTHASPTATSGLLRARR